MSKLNSKYDIGQKVFTINYPNYRIIEVEIASMSVTNSGISYNGCPCAGYCGSDKVHEEDLLYPTYEKAFEIRRKFVDQAVATFRAEQERKVKIAEAEEAREKAIAEATP